MTDNPPTLSARRLLPLIASVLAAALTASLGVWQIHRGQSREARAAVQDAKRALPSLPAPPEVVELERRVQLTGRFLPEHTVFLANRQMNKQTGFYIYTPFAVRATGQVLLVQRGFVPRALNASVTDAPLLATPSEAVELRAAMSAAPSSVYALKGKSSQGRVRLNLDLAAFAAETRLPLMPYVLVQLEPTDALDNVLQRNWTKPASGAEKNYGYAFQWFALCALVVCLYVWFGVIRGPRSEVKNAET